MVGECVSRVWRLEGRGFALPGELQPVDSDVGRLGWNPNVHRSGGGFEYSLWGVTLYYYCNIYSQFSQVAVSLLQQYFYKTK